MGGAITSHVLLDLLVVDTYRANGIGLPLLWPVSGNYYIAPILPSVDRSNVWQWSTIIGLGAEVLMGLGLIGAALVACRRTGQLAGNETETDRDDAT